MAKIKEEHNFINSDEINIDSKCEYLAVYEASGSEDSIYAIFELRDAIDCIKQMKIFYAKLLIAVETEENIEEKATTVLNVLVDIFHHLKEHLVEDVKTVKIYANTNAEFFH